MSGEKEKKARLPWGGIALVAAGAVMALSVILLSPGASTTPAQRVAAPAAPAHPPAAPKGVARGEAPRKHPGACLTASRATRRPLPQQRTGKEGSVSPRPQEKESPKEGSLPLASLGMPLQAPAGDGLDVAALKAACDKKGGKDLSPHLDVKNPAGAPPHKSPDTARFKASIDGYQGRPLSEKQFIVNFCSTFR